MDEANMRRLRRMPSTGYSSLTGKTNVRAFCGFFTRCRGNSADSWTENSIRESIRQHCELNKFEFRRWMQTQSERYFSGLDFSRLFRPCSAAFTGHASGGELD